MELKIEKGVPIPKNKVGSRPRKHGFPALVRSMEVNDMIRVPVNGRKMAQSNALEYAKKATKGLGYKFTTRKLDENTIGLWRVE